MSIYINLSTVKFICRESPPPLAGVNLANRPARSGRKDGAGSCRGSERDIVVHIAVAGTGGGYRAARR
jgi:hypothetical protein